MSVRVDYFPLRGGLDLRSPMLQADPGGAALMINFEVATTGGYTRTAGFERIDGQASPAEASYKGSADARRAVIEQVPGVGPVRGVAVYDGRVWAFRDDESAQSVLHKSTDTGWEAVTTPGRAGGGRYEFTLYNFTGNVNDMALYGVDGVNKPFELKGETLTELNTGVTSVMPQHIAAHKSHLFVSYPGGSVQHSGIGDPTNWDAATGGAGEVAQGDEVTALAGVKGDALAIFGRNTIRLLYGSSAADWQQQSLGNQADAAGALPFTVQTLREPLFVDDIGLRSLSAVQAYGNFTTGTLSEIVRPLIEDMRYSAVASLLLRDRNQYRLLDEKGRCLILTMGGEGMLGFGLANYPFIPSCAHHGEVDGRQMAVIGSNNGFVYRLDKGESFDGQPIPASLRLNFHIAKIPTTQKRWRKAVIDITTLGLQTIKLQPIFNFGHADVAAAVVSDTGRMVVTDLQGLAEAGGVWNVDDWGSFVWDGQLLSEAYADITGSGRSMALVIYSEGVDTQPFTLNGVVLHYSIRGLKR